MTALVVALSTVALVGCEVRGTAQRTALDIDAGQYKTVKSDAGIGTPAWMAGAELGAYVPYPAEIDERLDHARLGTSPLGTLDQLAEFVDGVEDVPENKKFQFGFLTESLDEAVKLSRSLMLGVLRYPDEGTARAAAAATAEANLAARIAQDKKFDNDGRRRLSEPAGFPAGAKLIQGRDSIGTISMMLLVPHGRDVLLMDYYNSYTSETEALDTLKRAVGLMTDRIEGAGGVDVASSMRNVDVVELTVPFRSGVDPLMKFEGTAALRKAYAHSYNYSPRVLKILTAAGVDVVGQRETAVFRAASKVKAEGLQKAFVDFEGDSWKRVGTPRDLPIADCAKTDDLFQPFQCTVVVGRYYATGSAKKLLDAQQKISAQYLILKERG
ncbi:hypothetical protein ACH46_11250 [Gordonia phthalatica]|uniref:Uncharacterized protein n=1 Tax=Gordonia phthalatica TaxID=1136941 RepID=A0A0N9MRC0_9ACTN|nr:hypothetical protein ACH46_11250 [Gordonia phthalatica]